MVYHDGRLDRVFRALGDPTRRTILSLLADGERTIGDLAGRFDMTLPAVSKHVRVLESAGLATVRREGRARHCRLRALPLGEAAVWLEDYRGYWEAALDRLDAYVTEEEGAWRDRESDSSSGARSRRRGSGSTGRGRKRKG
jgi:DNA-binding transcriptional ArsR family regulator